MEISTPRLRRRIAAASASQVYCELLCEIAVIIRVSACARVWVLKVMEYDAAIAASQDGKPSPWRRASHYDFAHII